MLRIRLVLMVLLVLASANGAAASAWVAEMDAMEAAVQSRDWQRAVQAGSKAVLEAEAIGKDSAQLAFTLNEVARMHVQVGTPEIAVKFLERLLRMMEKELGPRHASVGAVLGSLISVHRRIAGAAWQRDDAPTAEHHLGLALHHMRRRHGDTHSAVAELLREMAQTARKQGRADVAGERTEQAAATLKGVLKQAVSGRDSAALPGLLEQLGTVLEESGQPERARKAFEMARARKAVLSR